MKDATFQNVTEDNPECHYYLQPEPLNIAALGYLFFTLLKNYGCSYFQGTGRDLPLIENIAICEQGEAEGGKCLTFSTLCDEMKNPKVIFDIRDHDGPLSLDEVINILRDVEEKEGNMEFWSYSGEKPLAVRGFEIKPERTEQGEYCFVITGQVAW